MEKFSKVSGVAAPLPMVNIDTDKIIPKQFLKTIERTGLPLESVGVPRDPVATALEDDLGAMDYASLGAMD